MPDAVHILLVEDSMPVALDTAEAIEDSGLGLVTIAATEEHALRLIGEKTFGFAILDVFLGKSTSSRVAQALSDNGTSFVLTTGLGKASVSLEDFPDALILEKPYRTRQIIEALSKGLVPA